MKIACSISMDLVFLFSLGQSICFDWGDFVKHSE